MNQPSSNIYHPPASCQIPDLAAKYEQLLGLRTLGTFVEVGAYDGESFSNTCFLADLGWRGLYVEPVSAYALACSLRHANNNVRVAPCAVGADTGPIELHIGGTLTTTSARQVEIYEQLPWAKGNHYGLTSIVHQVRLDFLLDAMSVPKEFDLLVVDVEGTETEVFAGLNESWRPKVMIVEIEDEHSDLAKFEDVKARAEELRKTIERRGYREFWRDPINTIFTRL